MPDRIDEIVTQSREFKNQTQLMDRQINEVNQRREWVKSNISIAENTRNSNRIIDSLVHPLVLPSIKRIIESEVKIKIAPRPHYRFGLAYLPEEIETRYVYLGYRGDIIITDEAGPEEIKIFLGLE